MKFTKFPSLENTYREKQIHLAETLGCNDQDYLVTEKVHGANFSFWVSSDDTGEVKIYCAKRSGFIGKDEKFFDYKSVLEKYRESIVNLFTTLNTTSCVEEVIIYGELYGGNIQSGMCYKKEQDFIAFDLVVDGLVINKVEAINLIKGFGLPYAPIIGVYSCLNEALEVGESFESKLISVDFDGTEEQKESEGVVIEPCVPRWFPSGSRVYFKKKTKRFLEKGGNKIKKTQQPLPEDLKIVLEESFKYINEARFNNVKSKVGEVSIKDIGKMSGLMTQDILEDMSKDDIELPEDRRFNKLLQSEVMNFVRPLLLSM